MSKVLRQKIRELLSQKERVIVAIDGFCAAGKTTLANQLQKEFGANVFHVDDFFLRVSQKNEERLSEIGGNFDYERFKVEVIEPLIKDENFCYRTYDCRTGELSDAVHVKCQKLNIIEGSYCLHPYLGEYYDLAVFMEISTDLQRGRILQRDKCLHERFFNEWIPKEQAYFEFFKIKKRCQIQINNNKEK